jgi:hypothetical protein
VGAGHFTLRRGQGSTEYRSSALRWLSELTENPRHGGHCRPEELLYREAGVVDRWVNGELWLHVNVGIGAGLLDVEPCEFCAFLKNAPGSPEAHASKNAIRLLADADIRSIRRGEYGLNRPVLIQARQLVYDPENVLAAEPFRGVVRLTSPDLCDVCSRDSGELPLQRAVELDSVVVDREVDLGFPRGAEIGGRSSFVERPSDVVERGTEVVDDVPQQKPADRGKDRPDLNDGNDDAVTLSVVMLPNRDWQLEIGLTRKGVEVVCEHIGVGHCPGDFEPGALEWVIHGQKHDGLEATAQDPDLLRQTLLASSRRG